MGRWRRSHDTPLHDTPLRAGTIGKEKVVGFRGWRVGGGSLRCGVGGVVKVISAGDGGYRREAATYTRRSPNPFFASEHSEKVRMS